jgi:hypothetical protein
VPGTAFFGAFVGAGEGPGRLSKTCLTRRKQLPDDSSLLLGLRKLNLDENLMAAFPHSIAKLAELEELSIADNQLVRLSHHFATLTSIASRIRTDFSNCANGKLKN